MGVEEKRRQSNHFLSVLNLEKGRAVQWAPRVMVEAMKPLKKVTVEGLRLLANSAGSSEEDLEAEVYYNLTAPIRATWREKEGMTKVIEAKTTDEKVEIGRRYGKERKEMDDMDELRIRCRRVEGGEEMGFKRVDVTLEGKEGGREAREALS